MVRQRRRRRRRRVGRPHQRPAGRRLPKLERQVAHAGTRLGEALQRSGATSRWACRAVAPAPSTTLRPPPQAPRSRASRPQTRRAPRRPAQSVARRRTWQVRRIAATTAAPTAPTTPAPLLAFHAPLGSCSNGAAASQPRPASGEAPSATHASMVRATRAAAPRHLEPKLRRGGGREDGGRSGGGRGGDEDATFARVVRGKATWPAEAVRLDEVAASTRTSASDASAGGEHNAPRTEHAHGDCIHARR